MDNKINLDNIISLYEKVYNQADKSDLNKKRICLIIMYTILIMGMLTIPVGVVIYYIDYGINILESSKLKMLLLGIVILFSSLIVKDIIPVIKRKYNKLFRDEIISKVFKLDNKFEYNNYKNMSQNSYELMYRRLNFENKLFNIFNIKDIVTRKYKRKICIWNN